MAFRLFADLLGIQHEILIVRIVRHILKDSLPHACFGPMGEALLDSFVLTVPLRQVMPMSLCFPSLMPTA
jgi:hypothetical protein